MQNNKHNKISDNTSGSISSSPSPSPSPSSSISSSPSVGVFSDDSPIDKLSKENRLRELIDVVLLRKIIEENAVITSQEKNKRILDEFKNYTGGNAFKQLIKIKTESAVKDYAKEKEFKGLIDEIIRDTENKLRDKIKR